MNLATDVAAHDIAERDIDDVSDIIAPSSTRAPHRVFNSFRRDAALWALRHRSPFMTVPTLSFIAPMDIGLRNLAAARDNSTQEQHKAIAVYSDAIRLLDVA